MTTAIVSVPPAGATATPLPNGEDVVIPTEDGRALSGRLHYPDTRPEMAVVIHGGTGFPAGYYQPFACWLATTHRAAVLTYDYRDFGWSQRRPLRHSDATMSDWGIVDQSAALSFLFARYPDLPLRVVGHSLGGQWLAFHRHVGRVDRAVAVASGLGYWRHHPLGTLPRVAVFWWLLGPLAAKLAGYMPGRLLGLGADLPSQVYWEWRRLCLKRDGHRDQWGKAYPHPKLDEARFTLTLVPIDDDTLIPPHMVRRLPMFYPHATVRETMLSPAKLGLSRVNHGGPFLRRNQACWPMIAQALLG